MVSCVRRNHVFCYICVCYTLARQRNKIINFVKKSYLTYLASILRLSALRYLNCTTLDLDDLPPPEFLSSIDDSGDKNTEMKYGNLEDENYERQEALPKLFTQAELNDFYFVI